MQDGTNHSSHDSAAARETEEFDASIDLVGKLNEYRQRLLDLTARNRLLNWKESAKSTVRIMDEQPDQMFRHLVDDCERFRIMAFDAEAPEATDELTLPDRDARAAKYEDDQLQTPHSFDQLNKRLTEITRTSKLEIQETGASSLYFAIGFLEWYDVAHSGRAMLAPLVLIPVELQRSLGYQGRRYEFWMKYSEEDLQRNECLAEKLRHEFGIVLPELAEGMTPEEYFDAVTAMLRDPATGGSIVSDERWSIRREAALAFFNFQKILIYRDLDPSQWQDPKRLLDHPLVRASFLGPGRTQDRSIGDDYPIDERSEWRNMPLPFDADSSQHSTLIDVADGKHLVVEGPSLPGGACRGPAADVDG